MHRVAVAPDFALQQLLGLPRQQLVGEALERLAQHREASLHHIPRAQMKIAEPPLAASAAPLGRQNHQIQRAGLLDLQPALSPPAGRVGRIQGLRHHPLVPVRQRLFQESFALQGVRDNGVGDQSSRRDQSRQRGETPPLGFVQQVGAVQIQQVEPERRQRQFRAQAVHVQLAAEAAHGGLKRPRAAVGMQADHLAVQYQVAARQRPHGFHHFRDRQRHIVEAAREYGHSVARPVDLNPCAIQFVFERCLAQFGQSAGYILGGLGQHGLEGAKQADIVLGEPSFPIFEQWAGDGRNAASQHGCAADTFQRDARGAGHGFQHDSFQSPLAQFARQQAREELLFRARGLPQQSVQQVHPTAPRPGALFGGDEFQRLVNGGKRKAGNLGGRRLRLAQCAVPKPDLALQRLTGKKRDGDFCFRRRQLIEEPGERSDFCQSAGSGGDLGRDLNQAGKQHVQQGT